MLGPGEACGGGCTVPVLCCRCHRGAVTSLVTSPDGNFLFSTCSQGALVQYHCADPQCHVLRVAGMVRALSMAAPSITAVPHPGAGSGLGLSP